MSTTGETFQIPIELAESYEAAFVPAFFAQWAPLACELAEVAPGSTVLDVACGTGIVARAAADVVGPSGRVVGFDLNEAMLTVARRVRSDLEWRQGDVGALPYDDVSFDAAICQMALMFFPDRLAALREMRRVVRPNGSVVVVVPGRLDHQPAFETLFDVAVRDAGEEARSLLSAYFVCGDLDELTALVRSADLEITAARTHVGTYVARSIDAFVTTEVESTPLIERITDEQHRSIRNAANERLVEYVQPDGRFVAPFESNLVAGRRRT